MVFGGLLEYIRKDFMYVSVFKEILQNFNLKIISKTISFEIIISTGQFEALLFYSSLKFQIIFEFDQIAVLSDHTDLL